MYASLDCGAPSAKCTAGPTNFGVFFAAFGVTLDPAQKPPLLKPPFLTIALRFTISVHLMWTPFS